MSNQKHDKMLNMRRKIITVFVMAVTSMFLLTSVGTEARWTKSQSWIGPNTLVASTNSVVTTYHEDRNNVLTTTNVKNQRSQYIDLPIPAKVRNDILANGYAYWTIGIESNSTYGFGISYSVVSLLGTGLFDNISTTVQIVRESGPYYCSVGVPGITLYNNAYRSVSITERNAIAPAINGTTTRTSSDHLCFIFTGTKGSSKAYTQNTTINDRDLNYPFNFSGNIVSMPAGTASVRLTIKANYS